MSDLSALHSLGALPGRVTLAEATGAPIPEGQRSALLMRHGSMTLRYYAPRGTDRRRRTSRTRSTSSPPAPAASSTAPSA